MPRTITNENLYNILFTNEKIQKLFQFIDQDPAYSLEHRKDNKPILYFNSKKMFTFSICRSGEIKLTFPGTYSETSKDEHIFLNDVNNWGSFLGKYSSLIGKHLNAMNNNGASYQEDVWQFQIERFFNVTKPGTNDIFVINTEYGQERDDNRNYIDLILLKGLNVGHPHIVLCELKYGDGSLQNHGIKCHLNQYQGYLNNPNKLQILVDDMTNVFKQRCQLGLIKGVSKEKYSNLKLSKDEIEAYVVITKHNPMSMRLDNELERVRQDSSLAEIKKISTLFVNNLSLEFTFSNGIPFNRI